MMNTTVKYLQDTYEPIAKTHESESASLMNLSLAYTTKDIVNEIHRTLSLAFKPLKAQHIRSQLLYKAAFHSNRSQYAPALLPL